MPTADEVEVDVVHRLAGILAGIDHGTIALRQSFAARDLGSSPVQMPEQFAVFFPCLRERRDVLARYYEDVNRGLRVDVRKRIAMIILVNGFGRYASVNDLAEKAAHNHYRVYTTRRLPMPPAFGFFPRLQEASNGIGEIAVHRLDQVHGYIDQTVLARLLHQLRNAAFPVYVDNDKKSRFTIYLHHLAYRWNRSRSSIGLDNNTRNCGTHWTPQQMGDFRRHLF